MFFAGAAALAVGAVAFGALTAPNRLPVAEATTTTTTTTPALDRPIDFENFSVEQLEQGTPLEWERVMDVPEMYPYEFVRTDDWAFLFATSANRWGPTRQGGLTAWRSSDGRDWEALGLVIPEEHQMGTIKTTSQGLIALEAGDPGGGFAIWRSNDGANWAREEVAVGGANEFAVVYPNAVGAAGRLLVVAGHIEVDTTAIIADLIADTYGVELDLLRFGWSPNIRADDVEFVIHGPLGIPIFTASSREMGLSKEDGEALANGYGGDNTAVWVSWGDDSGWVEGDLPDGSWIESIVEMPNGALHAFGYGNTGQTRWESFDGLFWEPLSSGDTPWSVRRWGEQLVGAAGADILLSGEGITWSTTGLGDLFPIQLGWNQSQVAAGPGGIATSLEGWGETRRAADPQPVTLIDGDSTLTLNYGSGVVTLTSGSTSRSWQMWNQAAADGIEADLDTETLTFSIGDEDAIEATFTFAALIEAETGFWAHHEIDRRHLAFAFSPDGESWTIQDLGSVFGEATWVTGLEVMDERVIALVVDSDLRFGFLPGFEVWSAPIP